MTSKACVLMLVTAFSLGAQALPDKHEIANLNIARFRLSAIDNLKYDTKSELMFNPYWLESINTLLVSSGNDTIASVHPAENRDTTAFYYAEQLRAMNCDIYMLKGVQTKILRILINADIPVLLIGKIQNVERRITRVHSDLIYSYELPARIQSNRELPGEHRYQFNTVRRFRLIGQEVEEPILTDKEEDSPLGRFSAVCILTTPHRTIKDINKLLEEGLKNDGFEYKMPDAVRIKISDL